MREDDSSYGSKGARITTTSSTTEPALSSASTFQNLCGTNNGNDGVDTARILYPGNDSISCTCDREQLSITCGIDRDICNSHQCTQEVQVWQFFDNGNQISPSATARPQLFYTLNTCFVCSVGDCESFENFCVMVEFPDAASDSEGPVNCRLLFIESNRQCNENCELCPGGVNVDKCFPSGDAQGDRLGCLTDRNFVSNPFVESESRNSGKNTKEIISITLVVLGSVLVLAGILGMVTLRRQIRHRRQAEIDSRTVRQEDGTIAVIAVPEQSHHDTMDIVEIPASSLSLVDPSVASGSAPFAKVDVVVEESDPQK